VGLRRGHELPFPAPRVRGVFDAYPRLKIILGHLGEGLPFAMHRLNEHSWAAAKRRGLKKQPIEYLRDNLVVTTSGNWFEPAFRLHAAALGSDNILFAIDWPYEANKTGMGFLRQLSISDADKEKIAHRNASGCWGLEIGVNARRVKVHVVAPLAAPARSLPLAGDATENNAARLCCTSVAEGLVRSFTSASKCAAC